MEVHTETKLKKTGQFLKKNIAWVILILVVLVFSLGGKKAYNLFEEEHKQELENKTELLQEEIKDLKINLEEANQVDNSLKFQDDEYKNKYFRERKLRKDAENALNDIKHRVYSYDKLDSLAKHVKFR